MSKNNQDYFDLTKAELKMPEEDFLGTEPVKKSISLVPIFLGFIIVLLFVILGGLIWWGAEMLKPTVPVETIPIATRPTAAENTEPESTTAEAQVDTIKTLSSSDALQDIGSDLQATALTDLTPEITTIDNLLTEQLSTQN